MARFVLNIVAQRLPLMYRYDRDELSRLLEFARNLQNDAADVPGVSNAVQALAASVDAGAAVLDRARADPKELKTASLQLSRIRRSFPQSKRSSPTRTNQGMAAEENKSDPPCGAPCTNAKTGVLETTTLHG